MSSTLPFAPGNYRFIPGVFQYSAGVVADAGYRIERVRFQQPVPLAEGFTRIAAILAAAGRPLTAFCACELRSPAPFDEAGFVAFNRVYVGTLEKWGVFDGVTNPVARSNVVPEFNGPKEPSFHAFCYTVEDTAAAPSFVVAGSGEAPEGKGSYADHAIMPGDTSPTGMRGKARWVVAEMERRMAAMGFGWKDCTASQLYTVYDIHPFMAEELVQHGVMAAGLTWHFNRPPIVGLDYEMDCRGVAVEKVAAL